MKRQTVIVTGASSGIGFGIARYFVERGDNVVINSLDESRLYKAYNELGAGDNLTFVAGNVAGKETGARLAAKAVEKFGSIDVLVNNAGIFERKPFLDVDEAYLDRFIDTNLKGTFFATQAVIPQMVKQTGGVIINISTVMVNTPLVGGYATAAVASKGAINALTLQLATEFGKFNIRANVVALGIIDTSMHLKGEVDTTDENAHFSLLNRVGQVDDVAQMVYTVAKSDFITGAIINVDGGRAAGDTR